MRDWKKTLRRARYRGVAFYVESDDATGGKRLALHEYAGGRQTLIEEMGLVTSGFDVTAYLLGDTSDLVAVTLMAALQEAGPGMLSLPIDAPQMAYAQDFRRSRSKDRMGHIAFDIHFVPVVNATGGILSVGDVSVAVSTGFAAAASAFARLF